MPRLKGSKNKRKRRDSFTTALHKVLPPTTITIIQKLALRSNIAISRVLDDAVLEGASELETEAYASLIEFNTRRGKVIHEREPEAVYHKVEDASERADSEVDAGAGEDRRDDAGVRPGLGPENQKVRSVDEIGASEDRIPDGIEPEPREIPF